MAPAAPRADSATVSPRGVALLEALEAEETYYVGAEVSGEWRWLTIKTNPEVTGAPDGGSAATVAANLVLETEARENADAALVHQIEVAAASAGLSTEAVEALIAAIAPVTAKSVALGTIASGGTVAPDLRNGRVFSGTATAAWKLKAPTNPPSSPANEALYVELFIATSTAPTVEGVGVEGEAPVPAGGKYVAVLVSRDNGTTWTIVGPPALPSSVVRVSGQTTGQGLEWTGTEWVPATKRVTLAEVDTEITAKAIGVDAPLHLANTGGGAGVNGEVLSKTGSGTLGFSSLSGPILEAAMGRLRWSAPLKANATLALDHIYPIDPTAGALTLTMPEGAITLDSRVVVVQNLSANNVKLKGLWTSTTVESNEVLPAGQSAIYLTQQQEGGGVLWIPYQRIFTTAQIEALIKSLAAVTPGATTPVEAAEGATTAGESGTSHRVVFSITGDGATTVWKLTHNLNTKAIVVSFQTEATGKPKEQVLSLATLLGAGSIVATSVNEVTITFGTAPTAKTSYFVSCAG